MNANYTERPRQQSRRVPETELSPHPPFAQPGLQREIICMVMPSETSRYIKSEQHKSMNKLKRRRKAAGCDLRAAFMANQPNKEPLEQLLEPGLFAGPRIQTSKQGRYVTPMEEPQLKEQGAHPPRERGLRPTPTSAPQRASRGTQLVGPPVPGQGPSFRQRAEAILSGQRGERSQSHFVHTCNTQHNEVLHWNKRHIQRHAELGNQIGRDSECNKAQREAPFPPPPGESSIVGSSQTSFGEEGEVQRSVTRIPIACGDCEKHEKEREENEARERELARTGILDHEHRHPERSAKASMKGLWSIFRCPGWHRGFNAIMQKLHGDAQPILLGTFQNGTRHSLMARSRV
ncbi:hypothetical protein CEP54_009305 [Fusarium duplospermum]|uniref:Uncharacterized protein n=1 Tax=Fusarium duplospermum TaxID=1325734 RepID=A0A428PRJ7_9HYPO|nr:hypothetical protein CEP54_009305 [Fusarium duplospermum]